MGRITSVSLLGILFLMCWHASKTEAAEKCTASTRSLDLKHSGNKYKDPEQPVEVRVEDLLGKMSLEEKIGQMAQLERQDLTADIVKNYFIGSILSGGGSTPKINATAKDWVDMVNNFQMGALGTRLGIPMIYGIDAVHGHNNVVNATIFPHNIALGGTRDADLIERIGAATALEVRATGIPYAFAPCIAVCRDPRWGRCYESYSEDFTIVQLMTDIIEGLQGEVSSDMKGYPYVDAKDHKVAACAKHYVGDGGTVKGINENNTIVNHTTLYGIHMPAYKNALQKGVATVMASYSSINGVKMHANKELLTGYLKEELGFKGFVISDWQGIDRITSPPHKNYTYSIQTSVLAGVDMIMIPYNYTEFINDLTDLVKKNAIPMSRIDDAVRRILRVKFAMGLFENPLGDYSLVDKLGCREHREIAREAVRKSCVLLKNGKPGKAPVLPLPTSAKKILVAGTHSHNLGYQCGGWTIQWQGVNGNNWTTGTTILQAIRASVDKTTEVIHKDRPSEKYFKDHDFDYAIVVVGEVPYAETNGDSRNLTISHPGPQIIRNVCGAVKCVVVLVTGRPVVIEPYLWSIDALVAAWLPGTEGQGVADVLFGLYGFSAKTSRTWFKTVDQLPMNYGDPNYDPLFPYGFGLETKGLYDEE
ncbi:hypothetical protein COLO4_16464 [Corchorus olitorius]|uniref:Glycoside hydrolase, family 3 n=1 Tax=Corchorus olitorius TaxID=93759 RepID=A0A1R3JH97_9ROSI|nr:hypothetical protein COLO4_16464 [Corchorus olitorius]